MSKIQDPAKVVEFIPEPHQLRMIAEALLDTPKLRRGQVRIYGGLRPHMAAQLQRLAVAMELSQ